MADTLTHCNDTLHWAVGRGDEEAVKRLLKQCPELEALDEQGNTALHLACMNRSHRIVEILLNSGASVHTANKRTGRTPLHLAAVRGTPDTVALLLQRRADVRAVDKCIYSALHHAAQTSSESKIRMLLDNGADIEAKSIDGFTPLAVAISSGNVRSAKLLIGSGANVHWDKIYWRRDNTLLHIAAKKNNTAAMQLLLDSKVDVDTVVGGGCTALLAVAWRPHCLHAVEWLLKNGARINYQAPMNGYTALHSAVQVKATSTVQLLLEYGADLNVEDKEGRTPVGMAVDLVCSKMYPAFAKQLVMMKTQNLFVSEKNLKTLSEVDELKSCSASCSVEIGKILKYRIGNSNVKLFDVLSKGENKVARYAANETLKQGLEDGSFVNEFPIYGNVIRKKFLQGRERRDLLRRSSECLFSVINEFYELSEDCVEMINRCLTNHDLALQIG